MLEHIPRFSNIFLPFHVNQTQKHKHKLISSKNKNTNTNPATELYNVTHKLCGLSPSPAGRLEVSPMVPLVTKSA